MGRKHWPRVWQTILSRRARVLVDCGYLPLGVWEPLCNQGLSDQLNNFWSTTGRKLDGRRGERGDQNSASLQAKRTFFAVWLGWRHNNYRYLSLRIACCSFYYCILVCSDLLVYYTQNGNETGINLNPRQLTHE